MVIAIVSNSREDIIMIMIIVMNIVGVICAGAIWIPIITAVFMIGRKRSSGGRGGGCRLTGKRRYNVCLKIES